LRYELGDRLVGTVAFDPSVPVDPNAPPAKADQKATFVAFDKQSGSVLFDVPTTNPDTENPLAEIVVVFLPEGVVAATAAEYRALPDDTCPKGFLAITPEQYGTRVTVPKPENLPERVPFLGQALNGYAD
jgi:hypothetical protein